MTVTLWFLFGLWTGCCTGLLLAACVFMTREEQQHADGALSRLRGAASRHAPRRSRVSMNLLRARSGYADG